MVNVEERGHYIITLDMFDKATWNHTNNYLPKKEKSIIHIISVYKYTYIMSVHPPRDKEHLAKSQYPP